MVTGSTPSGGASTPIDATFCPGCASLLRPVHLKTVKHLLKFELARSLQPGRFLYCPERECDVVYLRFAEDNETDIPDEVFRSADMKERARPHERGRDRFICYCFGYTAGEIEDDATSGRDVIPGAIAGEIRAGNCACEVMNPSGG